MQGSADDLAGVGARGLDFRFRGSEARPQGNNVLGTSRLMYQEAFDGDNVFSNCLGLYGGPLARFPRVIRNIHVDTLVVGTLFPARDFLRYMRRFGCPSIVRGTLTVDLLLDPHTLITRGLAEWSIALNWFIRALGRFTNFGTIELHCYRRGVRDGTFDVLEYLESALEPVLGCSDHSSRERKGLRLHPMDQRNRQRKKDDGDWADSLDGIRLNWNEDTIAEELETPGQN